MKALIYNKDTNEKIELVEKELPQIIEETDAIIKVTYSSICTSDLHIIEGFVPRANDKKILGHEFVGEVITTGKNLKKIKKGDRVIANCITFCGECYFCKKGFINNCENGGWELGCRIDGGHAEYVRVPYADNSLNKIPNNVTYKEALFVGDILSSGYFGVEMCEIKKNDTVAVIGSGCVGLCSMMLAKSLGAEKIIAIDINNEKLKIAKEQKFCTHTLNPRETDIESEIKIITNNIGVDSVIEAAGTKETFELAWKIARPNAIIGIVAMYEENQTLKLPEMYGKNLIFKTGGVDAIHCDMLLDLISKKKISTNFLISKEYNLHDIKQAYKDFKYKPEKALKYCIKH